MAIPTSSAAVHRRRIKQLERFLRGGEHINDEWESYAEVNTDLSGISHDEADLAGRERHRDEQLWWAYTEISHFLPQLLATAEIQLQQLPYGAVQPRWGWQLGKLAAAQHALGGLRTEWESTRDAQSGTVWPDMEDYEAPARDRNAAAAELITTWVTYGHAIGEIHTAALSAAPAPPALATTPAPAPPAGQSVTARR